MAKYLDPKADLTFKRIFGEHPNLVASLLNSLLPLPDGEEIGEVEYMSPERVPRTFFGKNSIVDVLCKTRDDRRFIVEMQMFWSSNFKDRVLFNSAKVYVDQLEHGDDFSPLRPVYSLNLVDAVFEKDVPEFIHHYQMVHEKYTKKIIEGFHLVFVELPKFKPQSIADRKMAVLWLRFLTEIYKTTDEVPAEFMENAEIRQAVELVAESGYTREQLIGYDRFWDYVRVDKAKETEGERREKFGFKTGMAKGLEEGLAKGLAEGLAKGIREGRLEMARRLKAKGFSSADVAELSGLSAAEIEAL